MVNNVFQKNHVIYEKKSYPTKKVIKSKIVLKYYRISDLIVIFSKSWNHTQDQYNQLV